MASAPIRFLAVLLVVAQGVLALGAGRTLCLPIGDCSHRAETRAVTAAVSSTCGSGCHHHHHELTTSPVSTHDHRHGHDHPVADGDPDCGCHLHLPVPDRDETPRSSDLIQWTPVWPVVALRSIEPATSPGRCLGPAAWAVDAWRCCAQARALAVTSLQV